MDLNPAKIGNAVSKGLSIVCATCKHYWKARDTGVPGDKCLSKKPCSSPLGGGDFREYDGPITDLTRWCFVCGDSSNYAVSCGESFRPVGVCSTHLSYFLTLEPLEAADLFSPKVSDSSGRVVPLSKRNGQT